MLLHSANLIIPNSKKEDRSNNCLESKEELNLKLHVFQPIRIFFFLVSSAPAQPEHCLTHKGGVENKTYKLMIHRSFMQLQYQPTPTIGRKVSNSRKLERGMSLRHDG